MTLRLIAPAKLNLALEILSRRSDGYHELVSVMQTIDLADLVRIDLAPGIELVVTGERTANLPEDPSLNLAYRAAELMHDELVLDGTKDPALGVRIELDKGIPAGAGLGGGSSDAAAVIRGLNRLWKLDWHVSRLERIGARLGSDIPFFITGGAAFVEGTGTTIHPLDDGVSSEFTVFVTNKDVEDKTRRMYSLVSSVDWTKGLAVRRAAESIHQKKPISMCDYVSPFDCHVAAVAPSMAAARDRCREAGLTVVTTGAGPSFFAPVALIDIDRELIDSLAANFGVSALPCRGISSARATAIQGLDDRA